MAKYKLFSIRDSKVNAFDNRILSQNTSGEAIRTFTQLANDDQTMISRHPEDFALFELGTFDTENGQVDMHEQPVNLGLAAQYKKQSQEQLSLVKGA